MDLVIIVMEDMEVDLEVMEWWTGSIMVMINKDKDSFSSHFSFWIRLDLLSIVCVKLPEI
jgi:hypothetical protein